MPMTHHCIHRGIGSIWRRTLCSSFLIVTFLTIRWRWLARLWKKSQAKCLITSKSTISSLIKQLRRRREHSSSSCRERAVSKVVNERGKRTSGPSRRKNSSKHSNPEAMTSTKCKTSLKRKATHSWTIKVSAKLLRAKTATAILSLSKSRRSSSSNHQAPKQPCPAIQIRG